MAISTVLLITLARDRGDHIIGFLKGRFIEAHTVTSRHVGDAYRAYFPDIDADAIVTLTMALADGLFVASQVDDVALDQAFSVMATAILATTQRLRDPT